MTDRDQPADPGEETNEAPAEEELPFSDDESDEEQEPVEVDDGGPDWSAMAADPSEIEEFTSEYVKGTTQEYQGLAEEVEKASAEEWELQAVAASIPGVETGLVGFDDVAGTVSESEESYEAVEQAASSDLTMRIGSALAVFGLFLGSLLLGGWWFTLFVILVMVVSVGELYATLRTRGYRPLALFGLLGAILMGVGAHNAGPMAIAGWAIAMAAVTILFFSLAARPYALANTSVTILGTIASNDHEGNAFS